MQFFCPYPSDQLLWAAPPLHPGQLEQLPWAIPPIHKSTTATDFTYGTYSLTKEKHMKGNARRGDYILRGLHTMYNQNTYWGGLHLEGIVHGAEWECPRGGMRSGKCLNRGDYTWRGSQEKGTTGGDYIRKGVRMKARTWIYCLRSDDLSVCVRPYPPSKKSPFKLRLPIRICISYTHRRAPISLS